MAYLFFLFNFRYAHDITIVAMEQHYCYVMNPPLVSSHTEEARRMSWPFGLDIDGARVKRCCWSSASKDAVEWGRITWG